MKIYPIVKVVEADHPKLGLPDHWVSRRWTFLFWVYVKDIVYGIPISDKHSEEPDSSCSFNNYWRDVDQYSERNLILSGYSSSHHGAHFEVF